jgi:hypothetical protein
LSTDLGECQAVPITGSAVPITGSAVPITGAEVLPPPQAVINAIDAAAKADLTIFIFYFISEKS